MPRIELTDGVEDDAEPALGTWQNVHDLFLDEASLCRPSAKGSSCLVSTPTRQSEDTTVPALQVRLFAQYLNDNLPRPGAIIEIHEDYLLPGAQS